MWEKMPIEGAIHLRSHSIPLILATTRKWFIFFFFVDWCWLSEYYKGFMAECVSARGCHPSNHQGNVPFPSFFLVFFFFPCLAIFVGRHCDGNFHFGRLDFVDLILCMRIWPFTKLILRNEYPNFFLLRISEELLNQY